MNQQTALIVVGIVLAVCVVGESIELSLLYVMGNHAIFSAIFMQATSPPSSATRGRSG